MYQVLAKDRFQFDLMVKLFEESDKLDFWTEPRSVDRPIDVMVQPEDVKEFVQLLESFNIKYRVKIPDVQR